jgi:hypothetical protein
MALADFAFVFEFDTPIPQEYLRQPLHDHPCEPLARTPHLLGSIATPELTDRPLASETRAYPLPPPSRMACTN